MSRHENEPLVTTSAALMPADPVIELREVVKSYDGRTVVAGVSLSLGQHTYALIGPSGCGKSTLLRLMIGLIRPDEGQVFLKGQQLTAASALRLRRSIGYVIQDGGLFPHLTAQENVTLMAKIVGWDRGQRQARVRELAELTHFPTDGLDRYPIQLSGGQRQRVGLMRALMLNPDILLLDEPLGALDPMVRQELQVELREIFRRLNKTVVLVTHDLHEAAYFSQELILLQNGGIVQRGSTRELMESPANDFVRQFINAQRGSLAESPA